MDVTLVLTHRCNLACTYCYAGEHDRRDVDPAVLDRALDLLFADGAPVAQLGFFGGEPFLAFTAMQRAVTGAQERAQRAGAELLLQCTTNGTRIGVREANFVVEHGLHVTVSIDGVQAAHDAQRPQAGGAGSWAAAVAGLRRLLDVGADVEALLVVTPATAPRLLESVEWLWWMGVSRVGLNLELRSAWSPEDLETLGGQLEGVARLLLGRLLRGEEVAFDPFGSLSVEDPLPDGNAVPASTLRPSLRAERARVVVATGGNLYGCAPLVGEDRDAGPEAALRLGRLSEGPAAAIAAVRARGAAACESGHCACAAYLETGDPQRTGPVRRWFESRVGVLREALRGALDRTAMERAARRAEEALAEAERSSSSRRSFLRRLAIGSATLGLAVLGHVTLFRTAGKMAMPPREPGPRPPDPPPRPAPQPTVTVRPRPRREELGVDGAMVVPGDNPPPQPPAPPPVAPLPPEAPPPPPRVRIVAGRMPIRHRKR
jgi:uncharacterized protein